MDSTLLTCSSQRLSGSVRFLKEHGFTDLIANLAWADRARVKLYPGIGLSCWKNDGTDAMKMAMHIQALRRDGLEGFTVFNFDACAEQAFPILSTGPTRAE